MTIDKCTAPLGSLTNPEFRNYDALYWTYTTQLSDVRLPAFINALTQRKPVSFQGKVYFIQRILLCEDKTIVVLKVYQRESQNKSQNVF